MKDHGKQYILKTFISPDQKYTGKSGRGVSKSTGPTKFPLALACWPLSFISPCLPVARASNKSHIDRWNKLLNDSFFPVAFNRTLCASLTFFFAHVIWESIYIFGQTACIQHFFLFHFRLF